MLIGVPKENFPGEKRIALTPAAALRLRQKGLNVTVEAGLGASLFIPDEEFRKAGADITPRPELFAQADILFKVRKPDRQEIPRFKKNALHISFLDPFNELDLIQALARHPVTAVSLEMLPRTTFAQKMDALSSQANLSGYVAVLLAAERLPKIFPMLTTPAGTINPARVFVIGAGVAGLQAIATAKRLGARVEAFDTRPEVAEQVASLGAKFIKIDLGETGRTPDGYAKALTAEQLAAQQQAMTKICSQMDVVITTAQVFGRKAPLILTKAMLAAMKPGSLVVDTAVESGGNVEGSQLDREILVNQVRILGLGNLPSRVCLDASQMYANNLVNFIENFWDNEQKILRLDLSDSILKSCVITHQGAVVNERIRPLITEAA